MADWDESAMLELEENGTVNKQREMKGRGVVGGVATQHSHDVHSTEPVETIRDLAAEGSTATFLQLFFFPFFLPTLQHAAASSYCLIYWSPLTVTECDSDRARDCVQSGRRCMSGDACSPLARK